MFYDTLDFLPLCIFFLGIGCFGGRLHRIPSNWVLPLATGSPLPNDLVFHSCGRCHSNSLCILWLYVPTLRTSNNGYTLLLNVGDIRIFGMGG